MPRCSCWTCSSVTVTPAIRFSTFFASASLLKRKVSILPGIMARSLPFRLAIRRTLRDGSRSGNSNFTAAASLLAGISSWASPSATGSGLPCSSMAFTSAMRCVSPMIRSRGSQSVSTCTEANLRPGADRAGRRRWSARSETARCNRRGRPNAGSRFRIRRATTCDRRASRRRDKSSARPDRALDRAPARMAFCRNSLSARDRATGLASNFAR